MEQDANVIQKDIEATRVSLVDKIEALETRVTGTVEVARSAVEDTISSAKSAVADTVETVKSTVTDTVETVKDTFDLSRQVDRHPFLMVGGSVATGFVAGRLLRTLQSPVGPVMYSAYDTMPSNGGHNVAPTYSGGARHFASVPDSEPLPPEALRGTVSGVASEVGHRFSHEFDEVKRLAVDAAISAIGGMVMKSFPVFADLIKDLTQHFRAKASNGLRNS
jgi:hypothetical protein